MAEMDLNLVIRSVISPEAKAALAMLDKFNVKTVEGSKADSARAGNHRRSTATIIDDIKKEAVARDRLNRKIDDSAEKQARIEQQRRNQVEKSIIKNEEAARKVEVAERRRRDAILKTLQVESRRFTKTGATFQDVGAAQMGPLFSGAPISAAAGVQSSAMTSLAADATARVSTAAAKATTNLRAMGSAGSAAGRAVHSGANKAAGAVEQIGRKGKFSRDVLEAFVLYRGFVVLQEGAMAATRALIELEHELAIVQTQLNETGKDFQPLIKQRVIDTAQQTGASFAELAKAEFEIVSANIAVADSFEILELSAKAAAAGGLDNIELAFNAALSQVNAFGLGIDQFDEVFDKQFNLVKRGIFTYEQFATIVGSVSEAFASMGQDVETANAALAAISQVFTGKQIERGATGLRNAVLAISEAPEKFEALGIQVTDAEGSFRNFIDIGRDLKVVLDGMSEAARAATIKSIFPDERERRGINAFLGQLDQAEQFYVEQKFAAGDLEDAFQTVNAVLADQAKILANDVIPAFDPFLKVISGLVSGMNEMNESMPGFTKGLINAALAIAAIQATVAFGPGALGGLGKLRGKGRIFSREQMPNIPGMEGGFTPGGGSRMVVNRQAAAMSIGAGGMFGGASSSLLGSIGQGALGGFMVGGGAPGAAIGAAAGLVMHGLGKAIAEEGSVPAKSFAGAFSDELEARSGDIAGALSAAIAESMKKGGVSELDRFDEGLTLGRSRNITRGPGDVAFRSREADEARRIFNEEGEVSIDGKVVTSLEELNKSIASSNQIMITARETVGMAGIPTAAAMAAMAAREDVLANETELRFAARREGLNEQKFVEDAIGQAVEDATLEATQGDKAIAEFTQDFLEAVNFDPTAEQLLAFEDAMTRGARAILDFNRSLADVSGKSPFAIMSAEFNALIEGDLGPAADVFSRMGSEGEKLANVFTEIGRSLQAFKTLETLESLKFNEPATVVGQRTTLSEDIRIPLVGGFSAGQDIPPQVAMWLESRGMGHLITRTDVTAGGGQTSILESLGIDPILAAQMITDRMLEQMGLVRGDLSTEDFVAALFPEDGIPEIQLGTMALADSLFDAANMMRGGLLESTLFTADSLEMFGEELRDINRIVRQRAILEEMRGLATFAGVDTEFIDATMDMLAQNMIAGGQNFFDMLSDPNQLAALIANMEFGDISVDNSTQQNFVIRVSGDVSDSQIVALQQSLTDWQNDQVQTGAAR